MATMPLGGVDPHAHGPEMDRDAVAGGVRYPPQGLTLYRVAASQWLSAIVRAYNAWLAAYNLPSPQRLQGIALRNVDDVADALGAMQRVAKLGLVGAMLPLRPMDQRYDPPDSAPLWAAAQELARPISRHGGTSRWAPGRPLAAPSQDIVECANREGAGRRAMAALIFGGVCERSPAWQVGAVDFEIAWAPYCMHRRDNVYRERAQGVAPHGFPQGALPRVL